MLTRTDTAATINRMNVLVCVKQVPEPEQVALTEKPDGSVVLDEFTAFRMNRFDAYAVEEALRLKALLPAVTVDAVTVGPGETKDVIKRAIGMGADGGIHLAGTWAEASRSTTVADRIACYAESRPYRLVITGSMSEDAMNGQTGPVAAAYLGWPCATQVISLNVSENFSEVAIQREVEGGARERLRLKLPAVLSLQPGINRPRYPSLSNLLRANRQPLETVAATPQALREQPVTYLGAVLPPRVRAGMRLTGTSREKAEALLRMLKQKAFLA